MARRAQGNENDSEEEESKGFVLKIDGLADDEEVKEVVERQTTVSMSKHSNSGRKDENSTNNNSQSKSEKLTESKSTRINSVLEKVEATSESRRENEQNDISGQTKSGPTIEELRQRLTSKIQALRAQRRAPGSGIAGAPTNRQAILEARKKKAQLKKEQLKLKRQQEDMESKNADAISVNSQSSKNKETTSKNHSKTPDPNMNGTIFTKISLLSGEKVDVDGTINPKKRKKGPVDLLGQLKHVEAKKARIAKMEKEAQEEIVAKEKWKRAIKQAEGEKVRDDEKLLKKALKRQQQQKKKSAKEWRDREEKIKHGILSRQRKREENIAARKEMKLKHKVKKQSQKKKKRPGFEGKAGRNTK
ncbi:surfeit locus protein 6-domain-containing protein [Dipodascopsis uninucleata]